jgi:phosphoribosyl 1,2-cyclic phosphodiesterase
MKIKFWGVRGSIPSPGPDTVKIGGNTSCVEVRADNKILIFDMGTGARPLGSSLLKELPLNIHLFFSHMHHDHNQGFPFFAPAFIGGNTFMVYGADKVNVQLEEILAGVMQYPYFPVLLKDLPANMEFIDLKEGQKVQVSDLVTVFNRKLNHPDGVFGYRVEAIESGQKKVFTFCSDTEHYDVVDWKVADLAKDSDVFIYDAQYTVEEYPKKLGWGHSTWKAGVKVAKEAGVKNLVLFHHEPAHNDKTILEIEAKAKAEFPKTVAAYEGLEFNL